jgi:hypothetical protein
LVGAEPKPRERVACARLDVKRMVGSDSNSVLGGLWWVGVVGLIFGGMRAVALDGRGFLTGLCKEGIFFVSWIPRRYAKRIDFCSRKVIQLNPARGATFRRAQSIIIHAEGVRA